MRAPPFVGQMPRYDDLELVVALAPFAGTVGCSNVKNVGKSRRPVLE
jgi:hypothetical protein